MSYRILALDGGGTWALIQIKALMALYGRSATGRSVLQEFDLVAANSGGSIVLGGLVEDLPLSDILDLFENQARRQAVFSTTHSFGDRVLHDLTGLGPKYSAENKLAALQNAFPVRGATPLTRAGSGLRPPEVFSAWLFGSWLLSCLRPSAIR
jgi:patatin-like phospholipase/acyl hydrolase